MNRDTITVICTGNTCRSPMAGALLRDAISKTPELASLRVETAGIAAVEGCPASENSVKALNDLDINISSHRSKLLSQAMLNRSWLVLAMTSSHLAGLQMQFEKYPEQMFLFREFATPSNNKEIPDPVGMDLNAYKACRDVMVEAVPSIIEYLKKTSLERE